MLTSIALLVAWALLVITLLSVTLLLQKQLRDMQKNLEFERSESRSERAELMNRLASANWGHLVTTPLESTLEATPEIDEVDEEITSYIDFDEDWEKLQLTNPAAKEVVE